MRKTVKLMMCLAVLSASAAFAQEQEELVEKVAVRNRLYSVENRFELGVNFGLTLLSKLTDHYNFTLSGAYNIKDWLGLEVRLGYAYSFHTDLARQTQDYFEQSSTIRIANDAADLWEMTANGIVGLRLQPIYGKFNLMSELPVHFQLYLWLGGGAALLKQQSIALCSRLSTSAEKAEGAGECAESYTDFKASPLVSLALGFRLFVAQHHAIRLEARSYSYLDSYWTNVTRRDAANTKRTFSSEAEIEAAGGVRSPDAGITNLVQFDIGYAFIF